jgi:hypothetical protein
LAQTIWRKEVDPPRKKNTEKDRSETTSLQMESPPKENPCTLPTTRQRSRKNSRGVVVVGGLFGEFGSGTHEGVPGVGVEETVDVSVQNDLVRAHVVALKDGGESVALRVEVLRQ